jgi:hypothetical protein
MDELDRGEEAFFFLTDLPFVLPLLPVMELPPL